MKPRQASATQPRSRNAPPPLAASLNQPIPAIPIAHWRHYCYEVHNPKITKISLRQPHTYVAAPILLDAAKTVYGTVCDTLRMRPTLRIVPMPIRQVPDSCDTFEDGGRLHGQFHGYTERLNFFAIRSALASDTAF